MNNGHDADNPPAFSRAPAGVFATEIKLRIDRMPFSQWHGRLLGLMGGAHFFDAFDATAMAFVLPVLVLQWNLSPIDTGLLLSASYVGQFIGAIAGGIIAERVGRITTLQISLVVMAILSAACGFATGFASMLVLRALQGIGLGGEIPVAATYMNEVCPARLRGRMVNAIQLLFATGAVIAAGSGAVLVPHFGWQVMFFIGAAPILLAAILRRILPESPAWLASRRTPEAAKSALQRIERAVFHEDAVSPVDMGATGASDSNADPGLGGLFGRFYLRKTMSAWLIAFCASTVGYGIIGWMPTLYRTVYHLPVATALSYGFVTNLSSLVGAVGGIFLIDRLGRKGSLLAGFMGATICLGVLVMCGTGLPVGYVVLCSAIGLAFLGLPLAGIYVYAPELYPTNLRAVGTGAASAFIRVASILAPLTIGMLLSKGSVEHVFVFLAMMAALGAFGTWLLAVETTAPHP
jgi:putative MFS transporter